MAKKRTKSAIRKSKFAQVLSTGADQRKAAIAAGYKKGPGLDGVASRLARDPAVVEHIDSIREKTDKKAVLTRERALEILTAQAEGSLDDFTTGNLIDINKARTAGKLRLAQSYSLTEKGIKVQLYSSRDAIELLARLQGWSFIDAMLEKRTAELESIAAKMEQNEHSK